MSEENNTCAEQGRNIPNHWQIKKLGDVCENVEKVKRKEKSPNEELIYLDIGGLDNKTNKILSYKKYTWKDAPSRAQQIVFIGDILFSTVRTYMKNIAFVENQLFDGQIASSGFCVIRGNRKVVNPQYVFYYTLTQKFIQPLNVLQTGSSYPTVRDKDVLSQPIPLPPLPEQQLIVSRIEELLSDLENGKQQLLTAQQQLKVYRQSLLKWAFEGKLSLNCDSSENCLNHDSSDLCDEHDLKKKEKNQGNQENHKNHSSDNLPKGWNWVKLGAVCNKIQDGSHFSPQVQYDEPGENRFMYITAKNIRNDYMDFRKLTYVDKDFHESIYGRCNPEFGDVLLTKDGINTGEVTLNTLHEPISLLSSVCIFKTKKAELKSEFLKYYIQSPFGSKLISDSMTGTAIKRIILRKIKDALIIIPPISEQQLIVSELESKLTVCDKLEETIKDALLKSETLRQSILKKAFEGKLV